jgi:succinyl-diaminopimelate desuccinylase
VLRWLAEHDRTPDHCLIGEPTSTDALGDTVKIGRRGSVNFSVTATGTQGHTAYPHLADNPVPKLARLVDRLASATLDSGTEHFEPSTLAVTTFDVANPAHNVIPAAAQARFNVRFNPLHSADSLKAWVEQQCDIVAAEVGGTFTLSAAPGADCFVTEPGPLVELVCGAVERQTARTPRLTTSGGTSDARFVKDYCPVVELGPTNATIHMADERLAVSELETLTRVYRDVLEGYFSRSWS